MSACRVCALLVLVLLPACNGGGGGGGDNSSAPEIQPKPAAETRATIPVDSWSAGEIDVNGVLFPGVGPGDSDIKQSVVASIMAAATATCEQPQGDPAACTSSCDTLKDGTLVPGHYHVGCEPNSALCKGCTGYAFRRRNELKNDPVGWRGSAKDWLRNASSSPCNYVTIATNETPPVGAIAVFQSSDPGSDPQKPSLLYQFGHVCVVEKVDSISRSFMCSQQNWGDYDKGISEKTTYSCCGTMCSTWKKQLGVDWAIIYGDKCANLRGFILGNTNGTPPRVDPPPADTDTTMPTVPANLAVSFVSPTRANLVWDASYDASRVSIYKVYRDGVFVTASVTLQIVDSFNFTSQQYCWTVSAVDRFGNESSQSATVCAIPPKETMPLNIVVNASVSPECSNGTPTVRISWATSSLVDSVSVLRDGNNIVGVGGYYNNSFNDVDVTDGQTAHYVVRAQRSGNTYDSTSVSVTATCSNVGPGAFTMEAIGICQDAAPLVLVDWTGSAGADSYAVLRDNSELGQANIIYRDKTVTGGNSHIYQMSASNANGTSYSNKQTVIVPSDCAAPQPPVLNSISPTSRVLGEGDFTLTGYGSGFTNTTFFLVAPINPPTFGGIVSNTQIVSATQLSAAFPEYSLGFGKFTEAGHYFVAAYRRTGDTTGLSSQSRTFDVYNPPITITNITGKCRAQLGCTPLNGFDVRVNGNGFFGKTTYTLSPVYGTGVAGYQASDGVSGPVHSQVQLVIPGNNIPIAGTYTLTACNQKTTAGTSCAIGEFVVDP